MIRVGLTGGMGSGKSTVCRLFTLLGIPVYDSDARAKGLLDGDLDLRAQVSRIFGPRAYPALPHASLAPLNRAYVAERVFSDAALLGQLNAVVHPAVAADFQRWVASWAEAPVRPLYVIQESAILLECGADRGVDVVVSVSAPEALRVARAARRDGCPEETVRRRLTHQWSDAQREARAHHILHADEQQLLIPQVLTLHEKLQTL